MDMNVVLMREDYICDADSLLQQSEAHLCLLGKYSLWDKKLFCSEETIDDNSKSQKHFLQNLKNGKQKNTPKYLKSAKALSIKKSKLKKNERKKFMKS